MCIHVPCAVAKYCYFCWNLSEPPTDLSLRGCAVSKFQLPCVPGKEPDWRTCGRVMSMENCLLPILPRKVSKSWRRCEQTWISRLNVWFDRQKPECCFTDFELIAITFLVQYQYHYFSLSSSLPSRGIFHASVSMLFLLALYIPGDLGVRTVCSYCCIFLLQYQYIIK